MHARTASCRGLDGWLRRKLRCVRLKQCKQPKALRRFLRQHGVSPRQARELASSGRGWWCLANSPQAKIAMDIAWFAGQGLISVRGGDREEPPYSIYELATYAVDRRMHLPA